MKQLYSILFVGCCVCFSISLQSQTISPTPQGQNFVGPPQVNNFQKQLMPTKDEPDAENGSCTDLDGDFCTPCVDPQSGSSLACHFFENGWVMPIDVSGISGTQEVTQICLDQDSQGADPLVEVNLYCDPGGGAVPFRDGAFTPIAAQTYQALNANSGTCVCITINTPPSIDASCGTLWVEFIVQGDPTFGSAFLSTPLSCNGNFADGTASYIWANTCAITSPVSFATIGFPFLDGIVSAELCPAASDPCDPDVEKPSISCASNFSQSTDTGVCDASVTIPNPTYSDNCAIDKVEFRYREVDGSNNPIGPWSSWMDESNNTQTFDEGRWKIRWRATDTSGNKKGCNHFLDVTDDEGPDMQCKDATVSLSGGSGSLSVSDVDDGSTDNCGITSLVLDETSFDCTDQGTFSVTLTGEDAAGNSESCTAEVTVNSGSAVSGDVVTNNEGTGTGFTFNFVKVDRTGDLSCILFMDWNTADGTATIADNDYLAGSGVHIWPPGNGTFRYSIVRTVKDANVEPTENYFVEFDGSATATSGEVIAVNDDNGGGLVGTGDYDYYNSDFEKSQIEICDGKDNDGNGLIDDGLAAEIYVGHIFLRSQKDVYNFPPCVAALDGNLHIEGRDIVDLSPLSNLQVVGGSVTIQNTSLTNLYDLEMLNQVAMDIEISNNAQLDNLDDFAVKVQTFGAFHFEPGYANEISKAVLNIFPNPANEVLNVHFEHNANVSEVKIYNTLGEIVHQQNLLDANANLIIDTKDFSRGMYLVSAKVNGQVISKKLILE